jgi:uncharacterized Zn finger protein
MLHSNGKNGKSEDKARALVTTGRVRLTDGGASVTNAEGFIYRVDFDLGGNGPHCQCKGFEFTGWCKHLTAAYMVAGQDDKPEDDEPTDEEWAAMQEEEDRAREYIIDAGLDTGDMGSAAYALGW